MKKSGRVVIVTGGAKGIGREIARAFAMMNDEVVIADIDEKAARDCEEAIKSEGGICRFYHTDISIPSDIKKTIKAAAGKSGKKIIHSIYPGMLENRLILPGPAFTLPRTISLMALT